MKIRLDAHAPSAGARRLAEFTGILRTRLMTRYDPDAFDLIVNWGRSGRRFSCDYINAPEAVAVACNKLATAQAFDAANVRHPPWTTDRAVAEGWWEEGRGVVCRTLLRASESRGLVLASRKSGQRVVAAPLYTKYCPKNREFRVHVWGGQVIDAQEKRRVLAVPDDRVNWQIRNHDNGFVFARHNVELPESVRDAAIRAVDALHLDFGGVDVGFVEKSGKSRVYEVNTAPGLEGSTVEAYARALIRHVPQLESGVYERRRQEWLA